MAALKPKDVLDQLKGEWFPAFRKERERLDVVDRWLRWDPDKPHQPRASTAEYKELASRSHTGYLGLVVTAVAQNLYVEGYRRANDPDNARAWGHWQTNGMDAHQIAIHRAALAYGLAYTIVLPGEGEWGDPMPAIAGVSPREMVTFYANPRRDRWPRIALQGDPVKYEGSKGWALKVYDDEFVYRFLADAGGAKIEYVTTDDHGVGVCPVVRYANLLDLEARADGEVEPHIPVAARINQTTFDRLVVQRFASWVVRTIAGMSVDETTAATGETASQAKLRLKVEDILIANDPETKFGSLPASDLEGFIKAKEADIRDLAAVTQTPPHHLLGQMANLSAEALAAAEAGNNRKTEERKHTLGESHEQTLRLAAHIDGDEEGARDMAAQVRWRDMESRSLAQIADALGKLATMLGVPVEMLWEKIPGWTDQDVERAKQIAEKEGGIDAILNRLTEQVKPPSLNGAG